MFPHDGSGGNIPSAWLFPPQDDHPGGRPGEADGVQRAHGADLRGLPGAQPASEPAAASHAGQQRLLGGDGQPGGPHAETSERSIRWVQSPVFSSARTSDFRHSWKRLLLQKMGQEPELELKSRSSELMCVWFLRPLCRRGGVFAAAGSSRS